MNWKVALECCSVSFVSIHIWYTPTTQDTRQSIIYSAFRQIIKIIALNLECQNDDYRIRSKSTLLEWLILPHCMWYFVVNTCQKDPELRSTQLGNHLLFYLIWIKNIEEHTVPKSIFCPRTQKSFLVQSYKKLGCLNN